MTVRAPTFMLVGDSQAVGLRDPIVQKLARYNWILMGSYTNSGWSVQRTVDTGIVAQQSAVRPDTVLIVFGGSNDTTDPTRLKAAIRRLFGQVQAGGGFPRIVWIGPSHSTDAQVQAQKQRVAVIQRQAASELGFEWYDGNVMTADLHHTPDGTHFPDSEQAKWADRIIAVLLKSSSWGWAGAAVGVGAIALTSALVWFGKKKR